MTSSVEPEVNGFEVNVAGFFTTWFVLFLMSKEADQSRKLLGVVFTSLRSRAIYRASPVRDLVTMAGPSSHSSFQNYINKHDLSETYEVSCYFIENLPDSGFVLISMILTGSWVDPFVTYTQPC